MHTCARPRPHAGKHVCNRHTRARELRTRTRAALTRVPTRDHLQLLHIRMSSVQAFLLALACSAGAVYARIEHARTRVHEHTCSTPIHAQAADAVVLTYAQLQARTHTLVHARTCMHAHTDEHAHTRVRMHERTHAPRANECVHMREPICTSLCARTHERVRMRARTQYTQDPPRASTVRRARMNDLPHACAACKCFHKHVLRARTSTRKRMCMFNTNKIKQECVWQRSKAKGKQRADGAREAEMRERQTVVYEEDKGGKGRSTHHLSLILNPRLTFAR